MSDTGRKEFERLRELAWGLVHGTESPNFLGNTQEVSWSRGWGNLAFGFQSAAEQIAIHALDRWPNSDYLWYPLCYNYRHFLELSLKGLLQEALGVNFKHSHSLITLWQECKEHLSSHSSFDEYAHEFEQIDGVIEHFGNSDPRSTRFRYPNDTSQGSNLSINIHELVYYMEVFEIAFFSLRQTIDRHQMMYEAGN